MRISDWSSDVCSSDLDLEVTHLDKYQPAARCSTGEQKALLLGTVLAHADLVAELAGRRPVLLLDEVAAHLDPRRRAALFERLAAGGGQVWMTGTEATLFEAAPNARAWAVSGGRIEAGCRVAPPGDGGPVPSTQRGRPAWRERRGQDR